MTTLLQKAKIKNKERKRSKLWYDPQIIELCAAWAKSEVTFTDVQRALGKENQAAATYCVLANGLKTYFNEVKR